MISTFYSDAFAADIGAHVMPMRKFALVKDRLLSRGLPVRILVPSPVTDTDLLRVHTHAYVQAVRTGEPRELAESQKFPWSQGFANSVRLTNGAAIEAVSRALDEGVAAALASGYHHAHADHGEGFCTFNGLVIALEHARAAGRVARALIVDLDLHYGNGTASLLSSRPYIHAISIYGAWYENNQSSTDVSTKRAVDTDNCTSIPIPNGAGRAKYLDIIADALPRAIQQARPDVIVYQAGADPYREDPYSPLDLGLDDLAERDALVFAMAHKHGIPVAWVLAGGYTKDITKIVEVHANTFAEAAKVFRA